MTDRVPHRHAALIKAWADGAEIQVKSHDGRWLDVGLPTWAADKVYRVKPTLRTLTAHVEYRKAPDIEYLAIATRVERMGQKPNVAFHFEDGKLVRAEVLDSP